VNDPLTWLPFDDARRVYEAGGFDGVGYVLTSEDALTGLDLDHCRDPETGRIEAHAQHTVDRLGSYTEITPSRAGLRVWVRGRLAGKGRRTGEIEIYSDRRFLTVSGWHLEGTPTIIEDRQTELDALVSEVFGDVASPEALAAPLGWETTDITVEDEQAIHERCLRDEDFSILWNGDTSAYAGDDSRADLALSNMLREVLGPDPAKIDAAFRKSGLYREKWERPDYRQRTIRKALENTRAADAESDDVSDAGTTSGEDSPPFAVPAPLIALYPTPETSFNDDEGCDVTMIRPLEGGSNLIGEFVLLAREVAPGLPDHWPLVAFLTAGSVLVPHMRLENLRLNLWMLGIGTFSTGKGNIFEAAERMTRAAGKVLKASGPSGEGIADEQSGDATDLPFDLYTSGSPEGLLRTARDKAVLVSFEEASAFFEQAEKREYQAGIKQTLCRLYDGRGASHQLKKAGDSIHVPDPHVVMLAAINREDFIRTVHPSDFTSGFLSRMLIVAPDVRVSSPRRVTSHAVWDDFGRRLGEHVKKVCDVRWAEFNWRAPRTLGEMVRAKSPRLKAGEELFWAKLREAGIASPQGREINLDDPQEPEEIVTPEGRDVVRAKKLAALFELLSDDPRVRAYETGDPLPRGGQIGDTYLSIRDENMLRAVSLVAAGRAYTSRVLRWLGTSEDLLEQRKITRVIARHPGISESLLMKHVRSRGAVYMKRNLEMLERSGEIRKQEVRRGRGLRYYPGRWTDKMIREFEEKGRPREPGLLQGGRRRSETLLSPTSMGL
jgi:hypothetical protein